jgi:hypothetical protein
MAGFSMEYRQIRDDTDAEGPQRVRWPDPGEHQ